MTGEATAATPGATARGRWSWPGDRRVGAFVGVLLLLALALPPAWGRLDPRLQVAAVEPDRPGAFDGPDPWGRPWEVVDALPLPDVPIDGLLPADPTRAVRPATHWPRELDLSPALLERLRRIEEPTDVRFTITRRAWAGSQLSRTPAACFVYSRGPDGVDDAGRGDDCVIDWVRTPTEIFWLGSRAVLLLLAGLVVAAHAAARLAGGPRRGLRVEVARAAGAAVALTLVVVGLVVAAFWADDWAAGRALRRVTDVVDDLGGARPLGLPPAAALLGSFLGASALAVLWGRTRRRAPETEPDGHPPGGGGAPPPGLR